LAVHQQEIPEERIVLAKPYSYQLKNKNTLSTLLKWDLDSETRINDGDLVLYKDVRDPEVEIEGYRSPREGGLKMEVKHPKEVGLKIHTMYDEEGRAKFQVLLGEKCGATEEVKSEENKSEEVKSGEVKSEENKSEEIKSGEVKSEENKSGEC